MAVQTMARNQREQLSDAFSTRQQITIYNRSALLYWWPVWFFGYLFALITYFNHKTVELGGLEVSFPENNDIGVLYMVILAIVIIVTNVSVRGIASVAVLLGILALSLYLAYMGWWDNIIRTIGDLSLFMNLGFYVVFSTLMFVIWCLSVFVFDHLQAYMFRPGQMEQFKVFGGGQRTFDANGLVVHKMQDDFFRHWILGFGSGDIKVQTPGADRETFIITNVPFVSQKIEQIEIYIALKPDDSLEARTYVAGEPG